MRLDSTVFVLFDADLDRAQADVVAHDSKQPFGLPKERADFCPCHALDPVGVDMASAAACVWGRVPLSPSAYVLA